MKYWLWFTKHKGFQTLLVGLLIAVLFLTIFLPLAVAALWSLVDPEIGWSYPDLYPKKLSFHFWQMVLRQPSLVKSMVLSFIIAPLTTLFCIILSVPTGYALAKYNFPGRKFVDMLVLAPVIIPEIGVAVGLGAIFYKIGLAGTVLGVTLAHTVIYLPYMLRTVTAAFKAIPQDIIDAARNLRANNIQLVWNILIPMVLPGIMAGSIFTFIYSVEEFSLAFIIGSPGIKTLPVLLYGYLGDYFIRSAASVISLIILVPTVGVLFITERFLKAEYISAGFGKC